VHATVFKVIYIFDLAFGLLFFGNFMVQFFCVATQYL